MEDPNLPYRGLKGKGNVKIHEDINHNIPLAKKYMIKLTGSLENPVQGHRV